MHIDHQPLECLQSQTKIQQSKHFIWMGFLKQFHLVIKYKKWIHNRVEDMLSRTPTNASIILQNCPLVHERYIEKYAKDEDFKDVYEY